MLTRWYGKGEGSDMPIDIHVADAYELKDGKIVRTVFTYPDVATTLEAVGWLSRRCRRLRTS